MSDEAKKKAPSRRLALSGLGLAGLAGVGLALRKGDKGSGGHDAYFAGVARALHEAGIAQPTLVIDRARLIQNVEAVKSTLAGTKLGVRVVVKSLPAIALIEAVAKGLNTDRFMVFNGAMLGEMRERHPEADLLLGKPLPVVQAHAFYTRFKDGESPQWLIDTPERLAQYAELARAMGVKMRVNFEIDVGLHRGGFRNAESLAQVVDTAMGDPNLQISGLMGYDPHVPKTPNPEGAFASVQKKYTAAKQVLQDKLGPHMGGDISSLTLNTAGSPTYSLHAAGTAANEVSIGSAFVKPFDFDLKTLVRHTPAAYIATPVIKALERTEIPSLEAVAKAASILDPNTERAFFIYGGHWLARPVSPPGLQYSDMFGRSSNQEMLTGSRRVTLKPDDFVFLRPNQSEAVFLQFGDMALYDQGKIAAMWPTFPVSA